MNLSSNPAAAVIGLGYVGLPLAMALARSFDTIGCDTSDARVDEFNSVHDRTGGVDRATLTANWLFVSDAPSDCGARDVYFTTVPALQL